MLDGSVMRGKFSSMSTVKVTHLVGFHLNSQTHRRGGCVQVCCLSGRAST